MTSQIVTQTLKLTSLRVLYGKVAFANKFPSSLKIFIVNRNKFSLVSIIYTLKIINECQDNVKHGKNCTDGWFYFVCGVTTVGKIMLRHFTKKYVESRVSKLFITRSTWKLYFLFSNFGFGGVSHFPLYFLILTIHFSCLDQGLLPMVVGPFICWN